MAHTRFSCFSGEKCLACSEVPEVRDWPVFLFVKENILLKSLPKPCHVQGRSVGAGAQFNRFVENLLISSLQSSGLTDRALKFQHNRSVLQKHWGQCSF